MKVYTDIQEFTGVAKPVVTIGTFDGVHVGHQKLIAQVIDKANEIGGESVVLTFFPHPRTVLFPDDHDLQLITILEEKIELLAATGLDHLIIYPFSTEFSRLLPVEYVRDFLVNKLNVKKLVIGYDHHFGRNREGSLEQLKEYGNMYDYEVDEISAETINDVNVSSTKIRTAITEGDILTANKYLGRRFSLIGDVIPGNQLGRTIDFPTANLKISDKLKAIPGDGVYAVEVAIGQETYGGMLNIGKPSVQSDGAERTIEVHLFDFTADIYGETIRIEFVGHLRKGRKFESPEELKKQLKLDKVRALNVLE